MRYKSYSILVNLNTPHIFYLRQFEKMSNYKQAYSYLYHLDICQSRVQGKDPSLNSTSNKIQSGKRVINRILPSLTWINHILSQYSTQFKR